MVSSWHDAIDKQVATLNRAAWVTRDEELRQEFNQTASNLCAGLRVRNLDEVLLAAQREIDKEAKK